MSAGAQHLPPNLKKKKKNQLNLDCNTQEIMMSRYFCNNEWAVKALSELQIASLKTSGMKVINTEANKIA